MDGGGVHGGGEGEEAVVRIYCMREEKKKKEIFCILYSVLPMVSNTLKNAILYHN